MTMMITKFHKLIQNKVFWLLFSFLVIVSFVWWGAATPSSDEQAAAVAPGFLDGKAVDPGLFNQAKFSAYLTFLLGAGQQIPYTSEVDKELSPVAWRRLVSLRTAEDLGLVATDSEVVVGLTQQPSFQENGIFNPDAYEAFVTRDLSLLIQQRMTKELFEHHVREEMSLGKLRQMAVETTLVSPFEIERIYRQISNVHEAEYTILGPSLVEEDIDLSDEDVAEFFEANKQRFEIPDAVVVDYVRIPISDFVDKVNVSDAAVTNYYDAHLEEFEILDTDELLGETGSETNLLDTGDMTIVEYTPVEEVAEEIRERLIREGARLKAGEVANDLIYALTPDAYGKAPSFAEEAARANLEVQTSEPFTQNDPLTGITDNSIEFKKQAFSLYPDPDGYFSNPVVTDDAVFMLALKEQIPPRLPELDEVADQARSAAHFNAIETALTEKAREIADAVREGGDGATLAGIAETYGIEVIQTGEFSSTNGLENVEVAGQLLKESTLLNEGEVSDPVAVSTGLMLVRAIRHQTSTVPMSTAIREEIRDRIRSQTASVLFAAWQDNLLDAAGFEEQSFGGEEEEEREEEEGETEA